LVPTPRPKPFYSATRAGDFCLFGLISRVLRAYLFLGNIFSNLHDQFFSFYLAFYDTSVVFDSLAAGRTKEEMNVAKAQEA
jgi:hypothetical protein